MFRENGFGVSPNRRRAGVGSGCPLLRPYRVQKARNNCGRGFGSGRQGRPLLAGLAGTLMRIDGTCDRVRPLLARALAHEPGQWHSLWVLGDCFLMEGKTEQAEKSYRLAIQNSEFPDAKLLFSWARILESM